MLGSGAAQKQAADLAQSIRSSDFDKYMQNMYNTRNEYLGGQGALETQGFNASNNMASQMQKYFEDMAQAKGGQDMGRAGGIEGLLSSGLGLAGSLFSGGLSNFFNGGGMGNYGDPHASGWEDPNLQQPF
jgi:hypothetical protein